MTEDAATGGRNQLAPPGPTRILVVEHDPEAAQRTVAQLQADGRQVWMAGTAAEAEAMATRLRPDLILLDLRLPDASGLVLCARLRARSSSGIIVVGTSNRRHDHALSLLLGADAFLPAPFDTSELAAWIDVVLRRMARQRTPLVGDRGGRRAADPATRAPGAARPLRDVRAERLLTSRDLAEAVGADPSTIYRIEAGRTLPHLSMIRRIAAALNVEPAEVLEFRQAIDARRTGR